MVNRQLPDIRIQHIYIFLALFLFLIFITVEVMDPHSFIAVDDQRFENLLLSVRSPFFLNVFGFITLFGNPLVVLGIAPVVGAFLWYSKIYRACAMGLAVTLIGAGSVGYIMKIMVGRMRPGGLIPSAIETSFSFPSGHATAAMALYGFIAYLLFRLFPEKQILVMVATVVILGSIGFSRLYLGVHFPSDVLGGYILGGLWLLIGIEITKRLKGKLDFMRRC